MRRAWASSRRLPGVQRDVPWCFRPVGQPGPRGARLHQSQPECSALSVAAQAPPSVVSETEPSSSLASRRNAPYSGAPEHVGSEAGSHPAEPPRSPQPPSGQGSTDPSSSDAQSAWSAVPLSHRMLAHRSYWRRPSPQTGLLHHPSWRGLGPPDPRWLVSQRTRPASVPVHALESVESVAYPTPE